MDQELDIVVTGLDVAQGDAARGLALAFDLSKAQAELFVKELPRVAKRRASQSEAARYVAALRAIGARVETKASEAPRPTLRGRVPADERVPYEEPSILELPFSVPEEPRAQAFAACLFATATGRLAIARGRFANSALRRADAPA